MADSGEHASDVEQGQTVTVEAHGQAPDDDPYFPALKLGMAWGESITHAYAHRLEEMLQRWADEVDHGDRRGPFASWPLTGADVFWLAARTLADSSDVQVVGKEMERLQRAQPPQKGEEYWKGIALDGLHLEGAMLVFARLEGAYLFRAHLEGADLLLAHLSGAFLMRAHLERANLAGTDLKRANLWQARLEGASVFAAHLEGANLWQAHLEGADLTKAHLEGAHLVGVTFDAQTDLSGVVLTDLPHWYSGLLRHLRRELSYGPVSVGDIYWNDVDLTGVDWSHVRRLADERGERRWVRSITESEWATRANIQLARRLRDAGLNDDADRFAYRALVCQRGIHLRRHRFGRWLFSWLLFVVAGYGYRPLRTLFWYLAVIFGFAAVYFSAGPGAGVPLSPLGSLVFSITSFHGRGFFPGGNPGHSLSLDDPLTVMAAMEAVVGLFIEISFIATFTQRYFGK